MKKTAKRVLSLVMACLIAFSAVPFVFAAGNPESPVVTGRGETYNHYPQVLVKGFGASCVKIYYEDDPEQKSLFYPFDEERLKANLKNIDDYIVESVKNKEPNVLRTVIYKYIMDTMGMLAFKPDGSNMDGVVTEPIGLRYKGGGRYEFYYDCRMSPAVSAEYLYDCIQQVFDETDAEKIELVGSSYGANIVTSYMYEYPETLDKVDTVLLCAPSVGGMHFLGELLSGEFNISSVGLCDYIKQLADNEIIPDFLYLMDEAGVLAPFLDALAEPVLEYAVYQGVVDAARDFLATLPTLWVCVPDEYFESAMVFIYGENYKDTDHTYAKLISEMTYYHYNIANKAAEIYTKACEDNEELDVAIVTKFGIAAVPLYSGENIMDDGLVTLPVSSFGATCTTFDSRFPDDYVQQKYTDYNFMSPEWNIDASTGVMPFTTWYIKGIGHSKKISDYNKFVDEIIYKDLDVFSDPNRPQFMTVSEEDPSMLEPLTAPEEENKTLYSRFFEVIRKIVLLPKMIVERIKEFFSGLLKK